MQPNPLKWNAQADAYKKVFASLKRRMSRYQTVPLVAGEVKRRITVPVVYALKIGKAVTNDAFLAYDDAMAVAQEYADSTGWPIAIVEKKTGVVKATAVKKGKGKPLSIKGRNGYARNPTPAGNPSLGDFYYISPSSGRYVTGRSSLDIQRKAQTEATRTGRRITVHYDDLTRDHPTPYKAKPRKIRR